MEGSPFSSYVSSQTDLTTDSRVVRFLFGSFRCIATATKCEDRPGNIYLLTSQVPSSALTGWITPQVTVYLTIEDEDGQELNTTEVGSFTYTDVVPTPSYSPQTSSSRKRKMSAEPEDSRHLAKRPGSQPVIRPKGDDYNVYGYTPGGIGGASYPTYAPTSATSERSYVYAQDDQTDPQSQSQYPPTASPRSYPYYPPTSDAHSQGIVAPGHLSHWAHPYSTSPGNNSVASSMPQQSVTPNTSKIPPSLPSPQETNPILVRTSTLQSNTGNSGTFSPYGIYPHTSKAVLNIDGELEAVATAHWTPEELENRRKVVQFWRTQKNSTVNARFAVVPGTDRAQTATCISCIYWAEKSECYVTSVDCIYLLEALISARFTVEEKNRIRRNLEGYHPLTVSKAKADSENFFKLIMAFPNPKPRNIEKDVKVFPWKILSQALKKIIGKYVGFTYATAVLSMLIVNQSASYASTAAIIPQTPNTPTYPAVHASETSTAATDSIPVVTPPSTTESSSSAGPSKALTRTALSPVIKQQPQNDNKPISARHKVPAELQAPIVQHISNSIPQIWQQPHHSPVPHPKGHNAQWDMLGYVDSPATGGSANAQAIHYQRGPSNSDKRGGSGTGHQNQHISSNAP